MFTNKFKAVKINYYDLFKNIETIEIVNDDIQIGTMSRSDILNSIQLIHKDIILNIKKNNLYDNNINLRKLLIIDIKTLFNILFKDLSYYYNYINYEILNDYLICKLNYNYIFNDKYLKPIINNDDMNLEFNDNNPFTLINTFDKLKLIGYNKYLDLNTNKIIIRSFNYTDNTIIYKSFIGFKLLNIFKKYIPNIAYSYLYLECLPDIDNLCDYDNNIAKDNKIDIFTINEYTGDNSIKNFIKKKNMGKDDLYELFFCIFMQYMSILNLGNFLFDSFIIKLSKLDITIVELEDNKYFEFPYYEYTNNSDNKIKATEFKCKYIIYFNDIDIFLINIECIHNNNKIIYNNNNDIGNIKNNNKIAYIKNIYTKYINNFIESIINDDISSILNILSYENFKNAHTTKDFQNIDVNQTKKNILLPNYFTPRINEDDIRKEKCITECLDDKENIIYININKIKVDNNSVILKLLLKYYENFNKLLYNTNNILFFNINMFKILIIASILKQKYNNILTIYNTVQDILIKKLDIQDELCKNFISKFYINMYNFNYNNDQLSTHSIIMRFNDIKYKVLFKLAIVIFGIIFICLRSLYTILYNNNIEDEMINLDLFIKNSVNNEIYRIYIFYTNIHYYNTITFENNIIDYIKYNNNSTGFIFTIIAYMIFINSDNDIYKIVYNLIKDGDNYLFIKKFLENIEKSKDNNLSDFINNKNNIDEYNYNEILDYNLSNIKTKDNNINDKIIRIILYCLYTKNIKIEKYSKIINNNKEDIFNKITYIDKKIVDIFNGNNKEIINLYIEALKTIKISIYQ